MKNLKYIIPVLFLFFANKCVAQNKIVLRNATQINNATFKSLNNNTVSYTQNGIVYDINANKVKSIEKEDGQVWVLDQSTIVQSAGSVKKFSGKNQILFSPLQLLDVTAGIQIGLNHKIAEQLGWQNSVAYLFYQSFKPGYLIADEGDFYGFSYKTELKSYLKSGQNLSGSYIGPELLFKYIKYQESGTFTSERFVVGGHVKWGCTTYVSENCFLDVYAGLGLRWRKDTYGSETSTKIQPSVALGIKIGFGAGYTQ